MTTSIRLRSVAPVAVAFVLAACAGTQPPAPAPKPAPAPAPAPAAVAPAAMTAAKYYFVVLPEDGRMYAFGDVANYFQFLEHKEVALTRTRIGGSPMGSTLVFGITNDDVKSGKPSVAEQVFDAKLPPADDFYGEVFKNGRYYVFSDLKVMKEFIGSGEVPYSFTDIGAGPGGATLVWVVDSAGFKKGRPQVTIDRFAALRKDKK
ncbi:hypothetical protein [Azohydromonas sediminis]|uniref:hypothetical protein n=1 Tax=Azohydromonas sediminis TaxID=2259674 RepID=UPI0013C2F47A|nr:hypothetical protein [Azohydromonas sediminis]